MKALRWTEDALALHEVATPTPTVDEARVRVSLAGVCATDLEIVRGYMGFSGTLGHEFVGVVDECSDARWVGQRVCADINLACGVCADCNVGNSHHCKVRSVLGIVQRDGAFADHVAVTTRNLVAVPDVVSDDAAVFAEPLAAAFQILEQVSIDANTRVLVLGDGRLGLLCALVLAQHGCQLTVGGRHERKLAIARHAGALVTTNVDEIDFDVVVEATGSASGLAEALDRVRPRGTIVLKSTFADRPDVDTNRIVVDEIHVVGSRCGPMDKAVAALAEGRIDPTPLIDARFSLTDGPQAIAKAGESGVLKVLIQPSSA
ncbi:MAG: alcohol dehydrogenase catalytic domain-containing protein [Myxococcota bacterium]